MTAWNALATAGLLGTEHGPVPTEALPEALRARLAAVSTADREGLFLKTAALLWAYRRAGTLPPVAAVPAPPPCPPETRPYAPAGALKSLKRLLHEAAPAPFLEHVLEEFNRRDWLVSPDLLLHLLQTGTMPAHRLAQELIRLGVGERGAWLAQFQPAWAYALAPGDPEAAWQTGRLEERRRAFASLRQQDPARALALLGESWPTETVRERKEWIRLMQTGASPGDLPFLKKINEELTPPPPDEKPMQRELRLEVAQRLLARPESGWGERLFDDHLRHYFPVPKKGILGWLGGKPEIRLTVPTDARQVLTPALVHDSLGFPSKSSDARLHYALSETAYWLRVLMPFVPPRRWAKHWGLDAEACVRVFCENEDCFSEKGTTRFYFFLESLAEATRRFGDAAFAQALLHHAPPNDPALLSLGTLAGAQATEAYLGRCTGHFVRQHLHALARLLPDWSPSLSSLLLRHLAEGFCADHYLAGQTDVRLPNWHPESVRQFAAVLPKNTTEYQLTTLETRLFGPVRESVQIGRILREMP